jgi:Uma2 family endonuclease
MALARHLDEWSTKETEPGYEVLSNAGFRLRDQPMTLIRIPLTVVHGRFPTLESDWVPAKPLVAVEVFVGADRYGDMDARVREYLSCGVPVVWVINPSFRTVTVHRAGVDAVALDTTGTLTGNPELPGFSCPVADLFR